MRRLKRQRGSITPSAVSCSKVTALPCDARQARMLLEIARQSCPEIVPKIQEAMRLAGCEQS